MGYLFLSFALICGAVKGCCGKKTGNLLSGLKDALAATLLRVLFCAVIGMILIISSTDFQYFFPSGNVFAITLLSGGATSAFLLSWLISVKSGAYMMLDVFLMAGVILPIVLGSMLFNEAVGIIKWLGIAILIAATFIMCSYNVGLKGKMSTKSVILLIICGLANGLCDFSQKLFVKQGGDTPISVFNFYTYLFSAIIIAIAYFLISEKAKNKEPEKIKLKSIIGYISVMAVCLFAHSYFKTLAASFLDSAELYPLTQGASLIISTAMAAILFKEKVTAKCAVGLALSFIGLMLINIL